MADNVLIFKPRHELEHEKNLADFIEFGRNLPLLNNKYDYEDHYWPKVCNFTIFGASSRQRYPDELLNESLIPFAKAYITYGGATSSAAVNAKITAIRALHAAGEGERIDLTKLNGTQLDKAAQKARENLSQGAAYNAGRGLKALAEFLADKKIATPFTWKNPIKKAKDIGDTSDEGAKRREQKMPDENALLAIASISAQKDDDLSPRDIITTSVMTLLLSAPARGSEPFYLPVDCLHYQTMTVEKALGLDFSEDDIKALIEWERRRSIQDGEATKVDRLDPNARITLMGIRWYSGKGYGYENKWVPTVMYDAVETAVKRVQTLSERARQFAKLLEETPPDRFPRHTLCPDVDEDKKLTKVEIAMALGLDVESYPQGQKRNMAIYNYFKDRRISTGTRGITSETEFSLRDLNPILRKRLPEGFPFVPYRNAGGRIKLKWSEALFACLRNALSERNGTISCELHMPTISTLNEDLAPTKKGGDHLSIFQRWGKGDLAMTSHQMRHMLDTMAAVNGMSGELRAKWAQRSDPKHNRYYDHTTPEEYGREFAAASEKRDVAERSNLSTKVQVQLATPRTIQELNTRTSLTAHSTEFGMCITSYLSEPCTKYRDCLNCNEHVCIKGDDEKCARIRRRLDNEIRLLKKSQKDVEEKVPGAEQWLRRYQITTERCEQLLAMMDDPDIKDGALIKLANVEDVTLLDRAMDANGKKRLPDIVNYQQQSVSVTQLIGTDTEDSIAQLPDLDDLDNLEHLWED